jgi:4-hydroxythreonine-4-phosphate dehydrogenase
LPPFVVVGGADVLRAAAARRGLEVPVEPVGDGNAAALFDHALPFSGDIDAAYAPGAPSDEGARLARLSLAGAAAAATSGLAAGVVTAPVSKSQLAKAGFEYPGQTEFLAAVSELEPEDAVMMLAGPSLRTVPITIHIALADVARALSADLIVRRCRVVAAALQRDFGLEAPRLALCGLNPHAGENGRMGREEIEIIAPAIERLRAEGIDASGPHPADTLFAPHKRATYDVAIAMYHDQALVPLKTLDFDQGVNVTLGLPIVRTSPDHGTAFDIAGMGWAAPSAMTAATRWGGEIAARRGPRSSGA